MAKSSTLNIPRPKPNYFLSIMSIALVLFLLGMVAFLSWHANRLINSFKESINVIAEIRDSTPTAQIDELVAYLQSNQIVKPTTVEYIDREKAAAIMKKDLGDDFLIDQMDNPLFEAVSFNIKAPYFNPNYIDTLKLNVGKQFSFVNNVYYQETFVQKLTQSMTKIGWGVLIASILFLLIALTVMHNTLKLAMYSNRFLIKNMELVGASKGFIRAPFLRKSIGSGLLSGLLAILMVAGIVYLLYLFIPEIQMLIDIRWMMILFGSLLVAGIIITLVSTFFIVNKYLNTRTNDLF